MDRSTFLDRLRSARGRWESALARIPEARMTEPSLPGGWSVKDVVAHVAWSEREMAGVIRERALVGSPLWALDQDARNAAVWAENRDRPLGEVLAEERSVWAALLPGLESLTDEDLAERSRFREMSALPPGVLPWRIFAGSTFLHYDDHLRDLPTGDSPTGPVPELRTERLLLRRWREADREPFAAMGADPEVMTYLGPLLSRAQSDAMVDWIERRFDEHGFGLWAVEVAETGAFAGWVGLSVPSFQAPFMPAVEVGWRLARAQWGHGYAVEAARAAVGYGFGEAGLEEIVSFTVPANVRSRRVMERLGMTHDPAGDFDHPRLPEGDPLRRHVLYRLRRPA